MLQYVTGTAGTGKSTYILNRIHSLTGEGKHCVLMVPEQFSKTGEARLFSFLEGTRLEFAELYSFSQLVRRARETCRDLAGLPLDAAGKTVIAHRAISRVKGELEIYKRQADNFGFSAGLVSVFENLSRSGLDRTTLRNIVSADPDGHRRLAEISRIYTVYSSGISSRFIDTETQLNVLAANLPADIFDGAYVFFDGFEGFTAGQIRVIESILLRARQVTVALTCDSLDDRTGGTGNFSYVQSTARQLSAMARRNSVRVAPSVRMEVCHRFRSPDLARVDEYLRELESEKVLMDHVRITKYDTAYREVVSTAAGIAKHVREGMRYGDIAVICPQLDKYENQITETFTMAGIPYFLDMNRIISSSGPVMLFKSIFSIMAGGLSADDLLSLLRTQLTDVDEDDINLLDNYLFTWQDLDFDMTQEFTLSPRGIEKKLSDPDRDCLDRINRVRVRILDAFDGTVSGKETEKAPLLIERAYRTAERLGCTVRLEEMMAGMSEEERLLLSGQWEAVVECLDSLHEILLPDALTAAAVGELFTLMTNNRSVGFAPQTRDCVTVTDPRRMKLDSVEAVFVIGADSENFPAAVSEDSMISVADREFLKASSYPLKNDFEFLFSFENLYFYKTLTAPRRYLYISVADRNIDTRQDFSNRILTMKEKLDIPEAALGLEDFRLNREFFTDWLSQIAGNSNRDELARLLSSAGIEVPVIKEKEFGILDTDYLEDVLGERIRISPSRAQDFYKCRFMYFMKSIMKIEPVEKAAFDFRTAGTYLHYIAQKLLENHAGGFAGMSLEDIEKEVKVLMREFIEITYPPEIMDNPRFTSQYENMTRNAVNFMQYVWREQQDSSFTPIAFEEKIMEGGRVPPLDITSELGRTVRIIGVADRVDVYRGTDGDYLRIVDYKTGTQKFDLEDVYNGLSSQMLLYMSALLSAGFGASDRPLSPRAVMYQPSDMRGTFDKDNDDRYTGVGMAVDDEEIARAFDSSGKGEYGVIKLKKGKPEKVSGSEVVPPEVFDTVLGYVRKSIGLMADGIYSGQYDPVPLDLGGENTACRYCPYGAMCHHSDRIRKREKASFGKEDGRL